MSGEIQCNAANKHMATALYLFDIEASLANFLMTEVKGREPVKAATDGTLTDAELKVLSDWLEMQAADNQYTCGLSGEENLKVCKSIAFLRDIISEKKNGLKYWSGIDVFGYLVKPAQGEDSTELIAADIMSGNNDGITDFFELFSSRLMLGASSCMPAKITLGSGIVNVQDCEFNANDSSVITFDESLKRTSVLAYAALLFSSSLIVRDGLFTLIDDMPECGEDNVIPQENVAPINMPVQPKSPNGANYI